MKRLNSSIPGQAVDQEDPVLNRQLLCISLISMTLSFLVSIAWGNFVSASIEDVQAATKHKIPNSVSRIIAAVLITTTAILILCGLYSWERKAAQADNEAEIQLDDEE